jgi:signal transduction histidine kinase
MGSRMRAMDWSRTPLGPPEQWPQSLRSAVSILLPSRAQIVLFWGSELVTLYNDAYRPVFGVKHPSVLGLPAREAWSEIWDSTLRELFGDVVRTGEAFWGKDLPFILERQGFPEETFFDVSYDPVRDESGRVGGVFCIVSETTGRVVGERRLDILRDLATRNASARTSREVCAFAIDALSARPDEVPFALAYVAAGPSEAGAAPALGLLGSTPGCEGVAETVKDRLATDGLWVMALEAGPPIAPAVREVALVPVGSSGSSAKSGVLVVGLNPLRPFDEQYRTFLELVAGQLATGLASAEAYEEERKRAAALAELDRAKTAFFSNVSHEFRTPLTLMLGPLEDLVARAEGRLSPEDQASLKLVQRNGQRLLKLVNTLLDFARIEAGRAQAVYQPTDLAALTRDLASNFRSACERAGLAFEVSCPPLAEPAFVDREMWEKIVLNLLSNAFKFTLKGKIVVTLRDAGSALELEVRDTGTGIPAESLSRVFERFHRVEDTRGRSHEGSGIGLALVSELVRLHQGAIRVESKLGEGAAFTVTIPKGCAHLPAEHVQHSAQGVPARAAPARAYVAEVLGWLPAGDSVPPPGSGSQRRRIVLADDNADLREYARRQLAEEYVVDAVPDGLAALEAARAHRPDIVISDVMMPRLDGFGLIRELRADPELRTVPVILLSARAGEEARVEGLGKGADDYLVKPFSSRELLVRVGALVHAREALREADSRKDEFLATLSHELRNPLAPLRNAIQVLRLSGENGSTRVHDIMERQVDHLTRLVDDLLELSRITRGVLELRRERVELSGILRNAVETSEPLIAGARHRLELSVPGETFWLEGDPVRLAQILSNLLNNAAKYTPEGGTISLSAEREGDSVVISVRDNGTGIAKDSLSRIFAMFERVVHTDARGQGGLGIGLTLSRRLAEMHGGTIVARSEGEGRGSEFIVRLPLAAGAPEARPLPARSAQDLSHLSILVVDDNLDSAESLGLLLETLGADVKVAHDGRSAIELFSATQPAVVLLDIGMPEMDGYEVARTLRARYPRVRSTLVALTGWGQEADRRQAREAGFDHHLVKPAQMDALKKLLFSIEPRRADTA